MLLMGGDNLSARRSSWCIETLASPVHQFECCVDIVIVTLISCQSLALKNPRSDRVGLPPTQSERGLVYPKTSVVVPLINADLKSGVDRS